jgi:HPt (histidine-containing phosphotransfer) domain-containing protein
MGMAEAAGDDLFSQVSAVASDALYVAVGLGVLGFQRLQVRRRELEAQLPPEVTGVLRAAGERLGAAVADMRQLVK